MQNQTKIERYRHVMALLDADPDLMEAVGRRISANDPEVAAEEALETIWWKLRRLIVDAPKGSFTFDHGGHALRAAVQTSIDLEQTLPHAHALMHYVDKDWVPACTIEDAEEVLLACAWGHQTERRITVPFRIGRQELCCKYCGRDIPHTFDGRTFRAPPCTIEDGPCIVEFQTAGQIIFTDQVRALIPDVTAKEDAILQATMGCTDRQPSQLALQGLARLYAEHGIVHLVPTCATSLYQTEKQNGAPSFMIARPGAVLDRDGCRRSDEEVTPPGTRVVDLSWLNPQLMTFMDLADFEARGGKADSNARTIDVAPGRYRAQMHLNERSFVEHVPGAATIYATFERVN